MASHQATTEVQAEVCMRIKATLPERQSKWFYRPADESLRETIRSIVREELAAPSVQLGDLLKALIMVAPPTASSSIRSDEPDDDDLDDDLDSFGC